MSETTIKLKNYANVQMEKEAAESFYPGHLLELNSDGKFQKHSNAGESLVPLFAIEDALQGNDIDDEYSSDDPVRGWFAQRGDHALGILKDGQNVVIGDFLESAGDGTLQKYDNDDHTSAIVGIALEALDLSGSGDAESSAELDYPRNRIRVLII
ncbi:MAG: hypothetical protein ACLFUH_03220 [Bacteroidales bacterium]